MNKAIGCFLAGCVMFHALSASADTALPAYSYATKSEDGKFVFVMIAPVDVRRDGIFMPGKDYKSAQLLRKKYALSGLYRNDGSTDPLWTVGWYAYLVHISSDGVHLVREDPGPSTGDDEAIAFFTNGKEIRTYKLSDLVDFIWFLPHSVSHFTWEESVKLNDHSNTLTLNTLHNDRYVFDLTTGKVISSSTPARYAVFGVGLSVFVLLLGFISLLLLLLRRKRKHLRQSAVARARGSSP